MELPLNEIWDDYRSKEKPSIEEMVHIIEERGSFSLKNDFLETEYIEIQCLYKFLFGILFAVKSGFYKVDEKLAERGFQKAQKQDMNFFQKYDMLGSPFFYLRNWVHIERLTEEEKDVVNSYLKYPYDNDIFQKALRMVEKTYAKVLMVDPERKEQWFELFPSIYGEGRVQGREIVFGIKTVPIFNSSEMIADWELHQKKNKELANIIRQLEPVLSNVLEEKVKIIRE